MIGPYNSSVGILNLPLYRASRVLPMWNTSRDDTRGAGATVQPMNSQIAPIEARYVERARRHPGRRCWWTRPPTARSPSGMANRLAARLRATG